MKQHQPETVTKRQILGVLAAHQATTTEIAAELGYTRARISALLKQLERRRLVAVVGVKDQHRVYAAVRRGAAAGTSATASATPPATAASQENGNGKDTHPTGDLPAPEAPPAAPATPPGGRVAAVVRELLGLSEDELRRVLTAVSAARGE